LARLRVGVERGGFHLDGEDTEPAHRVDRRRGLAEWRIRCPAFVGCTTAPLTPSVCRP
jgi:hypothetical protein